MGLTDRPSSNAEFPEHSAQQLSKWISEFLTGFNKATPLFEVNSCNQMLDDWFSSTSPRDPIKSAAILVIIALTHTYRSQRVSYESRWVWLCNHRIGADINHIVANCSKDFTALRVVLGLAFLNLYGVETPLPMETLVGLAVTSCHKLKLHLRPETQTRELREERVRLYWITYIVDRDFSLLTGDPFLLRDTDSHIGYPSDMTGDQLGVFKESMSLHVFNLRRDLAESQGLAQQLMITGQGSSMTAEERARNIAVFDHMLRNWYLHVNTPFRAGNIKHLRPELQRVCIDLHMMYFHTFFASRNATVHNIVWTQRIKNYYIQNGGSIADPIIAKMFESGQTIEIPEGDRNSPLLPSNWKMLVESARSCLSLVPLMHASDTTLRW